MNDVKQQFREWLEQYEWPADTRLRLDAIVAQAASIGLLSGRAEKLRLPNDVGLWLHTSGWAEIGRRHNGQLSAEAWRLNGRTYASLGWFDFAEADFPKGGWIKVCASDKITGAGGETPASLNTANL